jgi:hypothetical protein
VSTELDLTDDRGRLQGRVDRLERGPEGLTVVDLKSGVHQVGPSEAQRRQLLLYSVLVRRTRGEWPVTAAVETATGERHSFNVVPEEAETVAAEASRLLNEYNHAVATGRDAVTALARPDADTCRHCPFRVACGPYWSALSSAWPRHGSVLGAILSTSDAAGAKTLTVSTVFPLDRSGADTIAYRVHQPVTVGETIAIVGATKVADGSVLRFEWDTLLGRTDEAGRFAA